MKKIMITTKVGELDGIWQRYLKKERERF